MAHILSELRTFVEEPVHSLEGRMVNEFSARPALFLALRLEE